MKDFLETLEIGDDKVKLSSDDIKNILKKHGEYIKVETDKVETKYKEELDNNKSTIDELKQTIQNAPKTDELESLKKQIADYEQKETDRLAKEKAKAEEEMLTKNINDAIGDTSFVNEYTRNAVINEVKSALQDKVNVGKSAKDLFNEIIKDKNDIISNPNQIKDMEGMKDMDNDDKSSNNGEIKLNPIFKTYN